LEHQPQLELKYDVVKKFIKIRGLATRAAD